MASITVQRDKTTIITSPALAGLEAGDVVTINIETVAAGERSGFATAKRKYQLFGFFEIAKS